MVISERAKGERSLLTFSGELMQMPDAFNHWRCLPVCCCCCRCGARCWTEVELSWVEFKSASVQPKKVSTPWQYLVIELWPGAVVVGQSFSLPFARFFSLLLTAAAASSTARQCFEGKVNFTGSNGELHCSLIIHWRLPLNAAEGGGGGTAGDG